MKVQVTMNDNIVKRIDEYANMLGISRSSLCAVWIGQGLMSYDKSFKLIDNVQGDLLAMFREEISKEKEKK